MTTVEDAHGLLEEAPPRRSDWGLITWLAVAVIAAACFYLRTDHAWLISYPDDGVPPIRDWCNVAMDWFVLVFKPLFRAISWLLDWPMTWLKDLLHWLPWPATIAIVTVMAHAASGWRLALFSMLASLYMVVVGYWDESMNTLALVGVSVPVSVGGGFLLGLLGFKSPMVRVRVSHGSDVCGLVR